MPRSAPSQRRGGSSPCSRPPSISAQSPRVLAARARSRDPRCRRGRHWSREPSCAPRPSRCPRPARSGPGRPLAAVLRGRRPRVGRARGADVLRRTARDRARRAASFSPSGTAPSSSSHAASAPAASWRSRSAAAARRGGRSPLAIAAGLGSAVTYAALVILSKRLLAAAVPPVTVAFWDCLVGRRRRVARAARCGEGRSERNAASGPWS